MLTGGALHLHEDDVDEDVLTAEQYAASWAGGDPCQQLPAELIREIEKAGNRARIREQLGVAEPRLLTAPLQWMPAYSYGGPFGAGNPLGVVCHSTEGPNGPTAAEAVAGPGWFGGARAGTSAHKIVDQDSICEGVHRNTVAWHVGPGGNGYYIGYEFSGYAGWDAATWRQPAQLNMLQIGAQHIAEDLQAMGAPARWLSVAQVAAKQKGLLTHNDVRLALGGTTHTDPGPNFPFAELLGFVQSYMGGVPAPAPPPPPSIPKPPVLGPWPYSGRDHFGNIAGDRYSHGGINTAEKQWVQNIQEHLIYKGCVSARPDRNWQASGWDDGVWGAPTDVAMTVFHQRYYGGQPKPAECWADDYARLVA